MKIVIIAGFFPYPAHFGGAYDVLERVKGLHSLGYEVDLVCTYKVMPNAEQQQYLQHYVNQIFVLPRKNKVIHLFSFIPLQVLSRMSLKYVSLNQKYDVAILESESVGMIMKNKSFNAQKVCVRVHNNESKYFFQLALSTSKVLDKLYYFSESLKFNWYSKQIFKKTHRLWFISSKELQECLRNEVLTSKAIYLPTSTPNIFHKQPIDNSTVLFVGALFMPNNRKALKWYLQKVHPFMLKEEKYKLIIVGSTGAIDEKVIQSELESFENVEVHLNQLDLQPFYKQSSIFINPMFFGTGVKLKSVNAIQNGLVLISTDIGSEGIGLNNDSMYLKANTAEEFISTLQKVFRMSNENRQELVSNAQTYLKNNHFLSIINNEIAS
jgi:polysaccharide biosynthesis protein PslH